MTDSTHIFDILYEDVNQKKNAAPETSYTAKLCAGGAGKICKKIGEEAAEIIIAALSEDKASLTGEIADFLYHVTVLMAFKDITPDSVYKVLEERRGISGITEKASRSPKA